MIALVSLLALSAVLVAGAALVALHQVTASMDRSQTRLLEAMKSRDEAWAGFVAMARDYDAAQVALARQRDEDRAELCRLRERRHTQQTVNMLEDLAAVSMDILTELKIFYQRMGALLTRLQNGGGLAADAVLYHREYCAYTRARLRKFEEIMHAGRRGPHSYVPPAAVRPARPGVGGKNWGSG